MLKVQRHLGEPIRESMVASVRNIKVKVKPILPRLIIPKLEGSVVAETSPELWVDEENKKAEGPVASRNYSKKWLKEKRGQREVQEDIGDVVRRLRALR